MASLRRCSNSLLRKVNLTGKASWWEGGWREDIPGRGNCMYKSLFLLPVYQADWFFLYISWALFGRSFSSWWSWYLKYKCPAPELWSRIVFPPFASLSWKFLVLMRASYWCWLIFFLLWCLVFVDHYANNLCLPCHKTWPFPLSDGNDPTKGQFLLLSEAGLGRKRAWLRCECS